MKNCAKKVASLVQKEEDVAVKKGAKNEEKKAEPSSPVSKLAKFGSIVTKVVCLVKDILQGRVTSILNLVSQIRRKSARMLLEKRQDPGRKRQDPGRKIQYAEIERVPQHAVLETMNYNNDLPEHKIDPSRYQYATIVKNKFPKYDTKVTWDDLREWAKSDEKTIREDSKKTKGSKLTRLAQKLVRMTDIIRNSVLHWWEEFAQSRFYRMLAGWGGCLKLAKGLGDTALKFVALGIWMAKTVASHGTSLVADMPKMLVNLFCAWPDLLDGAEAFRKAWMSKDTLVKFSNYGFFIGKMLSVLMSVVSGRKRKHRKLI